MKRKIFLSFLIILSSAPSFSQSPQSFKYQSVVRDSNGDLMANTTVGLRISIHDLTETGTILYQETHSAITNEVGLFSIAVGSGSAVSGTFGSIDWSTGAKFIGVEADFAGGTSYTNMGASQLLSVPFALYAEKGNSGKDGLNILNGTSDPTSGIGTDGEFYINTATNMIFGPKISGSWPTGVSLVGPTGAAGANGSNGLNVLSGISDPTAGIGVNGEFYINTSTNKIFGPKASGTWPAGVSLIGPPGSAINAWSLTGNSGTVDGTNFIGTIDNIPLSFGVNNQKAGRISSSSEVFFGYQAGNLNSGADNVGLGYQSLKANSTGFRNTSVGSQSLISNTTGDSNSSLGYVSLYQNTTGYSNTAVGEASMYANSTGFLNTAVGTTSLWTNTSGAYNAALGYFSLGLNSTGWYNSALGAASLGSNTTGNNNTSVGRNALYSNTSGNNNTAIGFQAGYASNSASSNNTFIGYNSGPGTSTQLTNATAIGYQSLVSASNSLVLGGVGVDAVKVGIGVSSPSATLDVLGNIKIQDGTQGVGRVLTSDANGVASWASPGSSSGWGLTGNAGTVDGTNFIGTTDNVPLTFKINGQRVGRIEVNNIFFGASTGENNTGDENIGLGRGSLQSNSSGYANTALGYATLSSNTTGRNNSAVGTFALQWNSTGFENSANGPYALFNNSTGSGNTAVGYAALWANTTSNLTAVGSKALYSNTTGASMTAIGYQSLYSNTTGTENTANGYEALLLNTTGNNNTAQGAFALYSNTTGSSNTALGYKALYSGDSYSNSTAIGYNAQVTASNMIRLGDANVTSINGAVGFTVVSDKRFKKDIEENVSGLPFIMKLRPVTYHLDMNEMAKFLKTPKDLRIKEQEERKEKVLQTGFIAQEVEKASHDVGYDFSGVDKPDSKDDFYGLRYAEFTVPLVKAVQEQQTMIDSLKKEIQTLKEQLASSQTKQAELKSENSALKETIESRLQRLEETISQTAKK